MHGLSNSPTLGWDFPLISLLKSVSLKKKKYLGKNIYSPNGNLKESLSH